MSPRESRKQLRWKPPAPGSLASSLLGAPDMPAYDAPLSPRDEAVFLLHTGAEIEHSLLVQYLYAAYSLKSPSDQPPEYAAKVRAWKKTLLGIAREEMGHLVTVQNLLRLIGGPLNLEREDYPFRSQLYPFHFRLEPLSKASLAKYVVAEMPYMPDPSEEVRAIVARAVRSVQPGSPEPPEQQLAASGAGITHVNRVGAIYARIMHLFSPPGPGGEPCLADEDFVPRVTSYQARYAAWGGPASVLVPDIANRAGALFAISELAEQGEGLDDAVKRPSHYQRFLSIYREFPEPGEWEPAHAVPIDPVVAPSDSRTNAELGIGNATPGTAAESTSSHSPNSTFRIPEGRITHPRSIKWATLFNLRYRLLLAFLPHFLQTHGPLYDEAADHTPRGLLNRWTFDEMRHLAQLASKLATLPRHESAPGDPERPERAGAPFDLPYTLSLPDREQDRWRTHLDIVDASLRLAESIAESHPEDAEDALLHELAQSDGEAKAAIKAAIEGTPLPPVDKDFRKVVRLLEEGVRGFSIGVHHNFWRGITRDQFVAMSVFGNPLIATTPDGKFDAAGSNLMKALRGESPFDLPEDNDAGDPSHYPRMPAHHPPVPPEAVIYIYNWIAAGCPDNDPPGQVGM